MNPVLIVEDEKAIADLIEMTLEPFGYVCSKVGSGEEAADLMERNGLLLGELKQLHNRFTKSADRYFSEFASMITTDRQKMDMFSDMDGFDGWFRKWAKLPKDWKPKQIEQPTKDI